MYNYTTVQKRTENIFSYFQSPAFLYIFINSENRIPCENRKTLNYPKVCCVVMWIKREQKLNVKKIHLRGFMAIEWAVSAKY